ncbi:DUF4350 domain-containing protein [Marininema halotolerans]|uniref:ABC-type uncharacterized transport system n=1 Tax=Marininema halotolerans TaxID=1155944 RepID=A0A1I6UW30_9BACL|nr:ABC-type uncharacterized transport system [Marininema halotolerans]
MQRVKGVPLLVVMVVFLVGIFTASGHDSITNWFRSTMNMDDSSSKQKKVLFDNTHGETAGAADWVIDGGFSDFADALKEKGYRVSQLEKSTPITESDLDEYDVFVMGEPNLPLKDTERDALLHFVDQGGGVFFVADHYNADRNKNRWDALEIFNGYRRGAYTDPGKGMSEEERQSEAMKGVSSSDWLATHFGIRFRTNAIGDVTANHIVPPDQALGITEGVKEVAMHAGATLAVTDPNKAKGIVYLPHTNRRWGHAVDQGVYHGGGVKEGPFVAIAKREKGKAAFIGDSSPVEDATPKYRREDNGEPKKTYDGFKEKDDGTLLVQLIEWLSKQEAYHSLDEVDGLELDKPSPFHPFEDPQQSVEPQKEPWAKPDPGYEWWNPATFQNGSYRPSEAKG